jgi:hypothetical protein
MAAVVVSAKMRSRHWMCDLIFSSSSSSLGTRVPLAAYAQAASGVRSCMVSSDEL